LSYVPRGDPGYCTKWRGGWEGSLSRGQDHVSRLES